jgi:multidrug resistance efflux pump
MRVVFRLAAVLLAASVWGCQASPVSSPPTQAVEGSGTAEVLEVAGTTQPAPGRRGILAPVVLHPVVQVLVAPGDRVKKDQPLVKLDDDEPQADVRAKKAALAELEAGLARLKAQPREQEREEARATVAAARVNAQHARELMARLEPAWRKGAIPDQRYHEAKASILRYAAEERAAIARLERLLRQPVELEIAEGEAKVAGAKAALDAARAELEHYTLTAPIAGVVSRLDVPPGTVSRPGTSVWGEILDLSEIDVCCELTADQADQLRVGQKAEVLPNGVPDARWVGQVVFVGMAADPRSGRVPVRVRVTNSQERLRCYVPVKVRITP